MSSENFSSTFITTKRFYEYCSVWISMNIVLFMIFEKYSHNYCMCITPRKKNFHSNSNCSRGYWWFLLNLFENKTLPLQLFSDLLSMFLSSLPFSFLPAQNLLSPKTHCAFFCVPLFPNINVCRVKTAVHGSFLKFKSLFFCFLRGDQMIFVLERLAWTEVLAFRFHCNLVIRYVNWP